MSGDIALTASTTTIDNDTAGVELVIEGAGFAVDGQGNPGVRVFMVNWRTFDTMNQITVKGGNVTDTDGAGILNHGKLTLTNSTVTGNSVSGTISVGGGGIDNNIGVVVWRQ